MQNAAEDEAEHLAYSRRIHLTFTADWNALAGDTRMRALCFDAMENAARGIDRFVTNSQGRSAFARKIDQVRMALGTKPLMFMSGQDAEHHLRRPQRLRRTRVVARHSASAGAIALGAGDELIFYLPLWGGVYFISNLENSKGGATVQPTSV